MKLCSWQYLRIVLAQRLSDTWSTMKSGSRDALFEMMAWDLLLSLSTCVCVVEGAPEREKKHVEESQCVFCTKCTKGGAYDVSWWQTFHCLECLNVKGRWRDVQWAGVAWKAAAAHIWRKRRSERWELRAVSKRDGGVRYSRMFWAQSQKGRWGSRGRMVFSSVRLELLCGWWMWWYSWLSMKWAGVSSRSSTLIHRKICYK